MYFTSFLFWAFSQTQRPRRTVKLSTRGLNLKEDQREASSCASGKTAHTDSKRMNMNNNVICIAL